MLKCRFFQQCPWNIVIKVVLLLCVRFRIKQLSKMQFLLSIFTCHLDRPATQQLSLALNYGLIDLPYQCCQSRTLNGTLLYILALAPGTAPELPCRHLSMRAYVHRSSRSAAHN